MKLVSIIFSSVLITSVVACNSTKEKEPALKSKTGIIKDAWGTLGSSQVFLYTLTNSKGTEVKITNYGGIVTSFVTADKAGNKSNIVVGFDSLAAYLKQPPYFGAIIGRYGNRIGDAKFTLKGKEYKLAANNGKNHLHGGLTGFDKVVWNSTILNDTVPELTLGYVSPHNEEGYPGTLKVLVQYLLTDEDELKITYNAQTDQPTPVNLTNHSYFNLTGDISNTILHHTLLIDADNYTPVDSTLIPTGEIKAVKGTAFDFTKAKAIGLDIDSLKGGYDHNWVLNKKGDSLQKIAVLSDAISGRSLEVFTTEPGLQFYTGNFLNGKFICNGKPVNYRTALCLETQHYPDSPNKPAFPSTILLPGQQYHSETIYKVILTQ